MRLSIVILFAALFISACSDPLPPIDDYGDRDYSLVNSEDEQVEFPSMIKGKIGVVGYIFTNCPDICPLTTNNMRMVQEGLKEEGENSGVEFVTISFDPETDTPEVLRKYTEIRNLDTSNWSFVTGPPQTIDSLMAKAGIVAVPGDSTKLSSGKTVVYYVHTDRISLVGPEGKIRKNYKGSQAPIEEIIEDVKKLKD